MGHPIALPMPRRISLPRIKFKKPRWPKGNRMWLAISVVDFVMLVRDFIGYQTGTKVWSLFGPVNITPLDISFQILALAFAVWCYWKSRNDDNGPQSE